MVDVGLRARVVRLLGGEIRADDLARLFLYARDRCDGRESVQEVGDFVAHHDERTKGIITRETRDWFIIARTMFQAQHEPLQPDRLPQNFREFLAASFARCGHLVKEKTGLSRAEAARLLPRLCKKFATNADGTLSITSAHSERERELVLCLGSTIVARPAFSEARLFDDFLATLKSHGLIEKQEMKAFEGVKAAISLFAVSVMHNSVIHIADGLTSRLRATLADGKIEVQAGVPVKITSEGGGISITSAIFAAELDPARYCEPDLLGVQGPWQCDVELTIQGRLGKLS